MFRSMRDDPFFRNQNSMFEQMDAMMNDFHRSMGMSSFPALTFGQDGSHGRSGQNSRRRQNEMSLLPFGGGSLFGNMDSMFQNMESMSSNPNCHSYSSSRVISYSNTGQGQPRYYEASSEMRQAPGGIKQTRKTERNSDSGLHRIEVGHHLYDRGHVVERSRNARTGDEEEHQNFLNMDEEEKDSFHQEWQEKARAASNGRRAAIGHSETVRGQGASRRAIADVPRSYGSPLGRPEQDRDSARDRERHEARHEPRERDRHVRINSRADQI